MHRTSAHQLAALAAVSIIATTGCSSSGDYESSPERASTASSTTASDRADSAVSKAASETDEVTPAGTHIARTADLSITVKELERASASVRSAARTAGGYVSSEQSQLTGRASATIVITVPAQEMDSTISSLTKLGTVTDRERGSEDLTKQYTDTQARVKTMTKAIARLRSLIDSTKDLEQIVTLEGELAEREANLESLVSQQKSLEKRTTTVPITVRLSTTEPREVADDEDGFLAGLDAGWRGLSQVGTALSTAAGAVLPFVVVGAAVFGPVGWWLRRRLRARPAKAAHPATPESAS